MSEEITQVTITRDRFYSALSEVKNSMAQNSTFLSDERYKQLINEVKSVKILGKKKSQDHWLMKRYDVLVVQQIEKLIFPLKSATSAVLYYASESELFDVLQTTHVSIGHGGCDRMLKELNLKYKNVSRREVEIFFSVCEPCHQKQKSLKKGVVVKPLLFSEFNSRCQVELIDFQSHPDGQYKFILVYQDHLTKFVVLRALVTKQAEEVASNLIDIFTLIGAPSVLQSDNGREFANSIVSGLNKFWPELKIVHGKPRHSQSQGSVERANQDIENMLTTWMQDHSSTHWSQGLKFVQLMKNRAHYSGIKRSPYEALFGTKVKVGLTTSHLPQDALSNITSEEELQDIIQSAFTGENQNTDQMENINGGHQNEVSGNEYSLPGLNCVVCSKDTGGAHRCSECHCYVHVICGVNNENHKNDEGYGAHVLCLLCYRTKNAKIQRNECFDNLTHQAKRMQNLSNKQFPPVQEGSSVRVPIPDVDKGRGDPRNLIAMVTEVTEDGFYRLGTRNEILKQLYARSQFSPCKSNFLNIEDIQKEKMCLLGQWLRSNLWELGKALQNEVSEQ